VGSELGAGGDVFFAAAFDRIAVLRAIFGVEYTSLWDARPERCLAFSLVERYHNLFSFQWITKAYPTPFFLQNHV